MVMDQGTQGATQRPDSISNILPKGWKREEIIKKSGITAGKIDVIYSSNDGKKFKSKVEMQKFLGDKYDLSLLDYKTGKQSTLGLRKQKRSKNPIYLTKGSKYDTYLNLPIRQTASIFKQPVTCVTNHSNETPKIDNQTHMKFADKLKPIQLFWELRFNGLKTIDSFTEKNDLNQDIDLKNLSNISSFNNVDIKNDSLLRSVAASLYLNPNKIITGQEKEFLKNPRIFINREQPLIQSVLVTEDEIKKQENRVKELRKNLSNALQEYSQIRSKSFTNTN